MKVVERSLIQEPITITVQPLLSKKENEKEDMLLAIRQSLPLNANFLINNPLTFSRICALGFTALKSLNTVDTSTLIKGAVCYLSVVGTGFFAAQKYGFPPQPNGTFTHPDYDFPVNTIGNSLLCTATKADIQFNMCPALIDHPWLGKQCTFLEPPPEDTPIEKEIRKIEKEFRLREEARSKEKEIDKEDTKKIREEHKKAMDEYWKNYNQRWAKIKKEVDSDRQEMEAAREAREERHRKLFNPTPEEKVQEQKEAEEEGLKEFEKLFEEIFGSRAPALPKPANCPTVDPNSYKNLSELERILDKTLNPSCPEHAKIILTQRNKVFDESLFKKDGCAYIKPIFRNMSLLTHPDKNPNQQDLATNAFNAVKLAQQVLCSP